MILGFQWIENGVIHEKCFYDILSLKIFGLNLINKGVKDIYIGIDYNKY